MTLRKRLAALAVAGLTLPGCAHTLLAPHPHRENSDRRSENAMAGSALWKSLFAARRSAEPAAGKPHSGDESRLVILARQLEQRGETAKAEKLYEAALREAPQNGTVHHRLGVLLAKRGDMAWAEEHLRAAVRENPQSVEAANDLGYCCFLQGHYAEAEAALRRALEIEPEHAMAGNNLARVIRERTAHQMASSAPAAAKIEASPVADENREPPAAITKLEHEKPLVVDLPEPDSGAPPEKPAIKAAEPKEDEPESVAALPEPGEDQNPSSVTAPTVKLAAAPPVIETPTETTIPAPPTTATTAAESDSIQENAEKVSSPDVSADTAIVRLVDQQRFAATCASLACEAATPTEENSRTQNEVKIPAAPFSAGSAASAAEVEEAEAEAFVRYVPVVATPEAAPTAVRPRRSLFATVGLNLGRQDAPSAERSRGSLPIAERVAGSARATDGAKQKLAPPTKRRSLMSALGSLNFFDGQPDHPQSN